ncbi:MAG: hypothetical protein LBJ18_01420 [Rickettsiales bacterium]|jgi:hypothetical protein|nr:hypothetical protein [Rickettsiales bacterium]
MNELTNYLVLKCPDGSESGDLLRFAENAAANNISVISAAADSAPLLWSWLESYPVQIFARFDFNSAPDALAREINASFKRGSAGAIIEISSENSKGQKDKRTNGQKEDDKCPSVLLSFCPLYDFVSDFLPIRNDLFFNKKLFIALDIGSIQPGDWTEIFSQLEKISADGIVLTLSAKDKRTKGQKDNKKCPSDHLSICPYFVGQVYGFAESIGNWIGEIYFDLPDAQQNQNAFRLLEKMRPDLLPRVRFFIGK